MLRNFLTEGFTIPQLFLLASFFAFFSFRFSFSDLVAAFLSSFLMIFLYCCILSPCFPVNLACAKHLPPLCLLTDFDLLHEYTPTIFHPHLLHNKAYSFPQESQLRGLFFYRYDVHE